MEAWLTARRTYPPGARSRGVEGVVTLRYRLAADGQVLEAVAEGADPELNAAAEAMLRGARPPAPGAPVSRTTRIRYRLE